MSEPETPKEPSIVMTRKDKRDLLLVGAAVVVAVIVVSALMIPPPPKERELTASLEPGILSLSAGRSMEVEVVPMLDDRRLSSEFLECEWHVNPYWLGTIADESGSELRQRSNGLPAKVNFTAGRYVLAGNLTCIVTYNDLIAVAVADITVGPPVLEEARITPADTQILVNRNMTFALVVKDSLGDGVANFSATWSVSGLPSSECEMNRTTGESVKLMPKTLGSIALGASVDRGSETLSCNTSVEVIAEPPRTVNYRWYDMFNVSFGERWMNSLPRYLLQLYDTWKTDAYPYLLEHPRGGASYDTLAGMRLNITGRNLTEISMNERPQFLPFLGPGRGGNAVIDWYMQYLTFDEIISRYPSFASQHDGWIIVLNGTAILDRKAAEAVLNMTEDEFDTFESWWSEHVADVREGYSAWISSVEPLRLKVEDVYWSGFQLFQLGLNASKVEEKIILSFDTVTWGMDALMMRWLHESCLPTEWWIEDMRFHAEIGPCSADIDIDAAVPGVVRASNSTQTGDSCWMWEGMLQNLVPYSSHWPSSLYSSPYYMVNERYMDMGSWVLPWDPMPGGLPITYTPGSFNLSNGEKLRFEWPDENVPFMTYPFLQNWTSVSTGIAAGYSEPNQTDILAGQCDLNLTARYLEFIGPFDFWTWSKDQTAHPYLADKWQLFQLLPYGMPYLEFWPAP